MGRNRPIVGEEIDVKEVAVLAEVVEHARVEEGAPETATVVADLETKYQLRQSGQIVKACLKAIMANHYGYHG